jgi:hypothetical protein
VGTPRIILPAELSGAVFTLADARALGVGEGRLRGSDLERPFRGVRAHGVDLTDVRCRCRAVAVGLPEGCLFSHETAARLWGMPLPRGAGGATELDVLTTEGRDGLRAAGINGRSTALPVEVATIAGMRVAAAAEVWGQLADPSLTTFTREWLAAVGDFLVSGARTDFGRAAPLTTLSGLADVVVRHGSKRGAADLRWAFARIRRPVDSVRETFLRLALVDGGLPEPTVQPRIRTAHGDRHADLGYRDERLLLEYLGDVHRASRARWLDDLTRVQLFEDAGWRVLMIGFADLHPDPGPLVERVRRALAHQ